MSLLKLAQLGEPVLRIAAEPVDLAELRSDQAQRLIDDMIDTMRDADGVGIAAPQVFASARIFAIEVRNADRYRNAEVFPLLVVINPVVTPIGHETADGWEGCLSVDGLRGLVPRRTSVHLTGIDREGRDVDLELRGFPATVAQHEADHLDGLVYLDRMAGMISLSFEHEYHRYHVRNVGVSPPVNALATEGPDGTEEVEVDTDDE